MATASIQNRTVNSGWALEKLIQKRGTYSKGRQQTVAFQTLPAFRDIKEIHQLTERGKIDEILEEGARLAGGIANRMLLPELMLHVKPFIGDFAGGPSTVKNFTNLAKLMRLNKHIPNRMTPRQWRQKVDEARKDLRGKQGAIRICGDIRSVGLCKERAPCCSLAAENALSLLLFFAERDAP